jgi:hypothetical protein
MVVLESMLAVPHLHEGADDTFGLAVCLGSVDFGELFADAVLLAGLDEGVVVSALIFLAVVGVCVIGLVRAMGDMTLPTKCRAALPWVLSGRMSAYSSLEKSSMAMNRYSLGCVGDWPLSKGRRLVSKWTSCQGTSCCIAWPRVSVGLGWHARPWPAASNQTETS